MNYEIKRIPLITVDSYLKVEMVTRTGSRGSDCGNKLTLIDVVSRLDVKLGGVRLKRLIAVAVVDKNVVSV